MEIVVHGIASRAASVSIFRFEQWIGIIEHLEKLVSSPDASLKHGRISLIEFRSSSFGSVKIMTSSAYMAILFLG